MITDRPTMPQPTTAMSDPGTEAAGDCSAGTRPVVNTVADDEIYS